MKKIVYLVLVSLFILPGCQFGQAEAPSGDPEDILSQAFANWKEVYSGEYELTLDGNLVNSDGSTPEKMQIGGVLDGLFDLNDPSYPEIQIHAEGEVATDGESDGPFDLDLRTDGHTLYALISEFPNTANDISSELTEYFVGKWWKIPLPDAFFADAPLKLWTNKNIEEELESGEQELKTLLDDVNFFKNIQYMGTSRVMGEQAYHYSAMMDKAAVREFINQASMIDAERITEEDLNNFANTLNASDLDIEVWVGVDDMIMRKVVGVFDMDIGNGGEMNVDFELVTGKLNKDVDIVEPKGAQELDPFQYMEAAGGDFGEDFDYDFAAE